MNHEVVSERWPCPTCNAPLRLFFVPGPADDDGHSDDVVLDDVRCAHGHVLPEELIDRIDREAGDELQRALEGGFQIAEVWWAPKPSP